jgi:HAD superfamily hydrolase (TIGR01509 family)
MIRGVLFDFDETLVNSLDTFWHVFNHSASKAGLPAADREKVASGMSHGFGLPDLIKTIYPEVDTDTIEIFVNGLHLSMSEMLPHYPVTLKPEAADVLRVIHDAGLKIGMVTARNMSVKSLRRELEGFNINHYFDCIVTSRDHLRKPSPDGVHVCLEKLGLNPEEAVLVGDAEADIIAGQEAGVAVILLADGTHYTANLPTARNCCAIIGHLNELPGYLKLAEGV